MLEARRPVVEGRRRGAAGAAEEDAEVEVGRYTAHRPAAAKVDRRREVPLRKPILPVRAYARCLVVLLNDRTDFEPMLIHYELPPP